MNDTQFDNFFNDRFKDHAVPVPAGLWDKVVEGQFDRFIGSKLREAEAPVPNADGLWEKINDKLFDHFVGNSLQHTEAPVPEGVWDKIADKQFDHFVAGTLEPTEAPVPAGLWDKIADGQFDAFVAGKLKDHEAPVPAGLWEKIMPEEDDDDKVIFWWFRYPAAAVLLLGLLTAGAIGGYFYLIHQQEADTAVHLKKQLPATQGISGQEEHQPTQTGNSPDAPQNEKAAPSSIHIPPADAANKEAAANPSGSSSNKNLSSPGNREESNSTESSAASVTGLRKKKAIDLRPVHTNDLNDLTQRAYDPFIDKNNTAQVSAGNTEEMESYPDRLRLAGLTMPAGLNTNTQSQSLFDKQLSTLNHTAQFKNVIICPSDNKNRNTDWYLEAYASPDIPFKSFNNVSASQLYLLKKDSAESMQVSYTAGLRLVKPITDNFLVKAGLQYSQINQKYVYRTENEVKTTTVVTVRTIIRAPGDTVVVQDTSVLQTVGFRTNTVRNRFRTIDVPVTVGYQFGNDDLKIGINAGVVVNLSSWYQGVLLDSSLATVPINKSGNGVYKTNIGLGLIGGISVIKKLSDDMQVFFEPYFRYNLSNMTTGQASYQQKFSVGGLSLGLRLNLNRK
jgi:hypothetical protein